MQSSILRRGTYFTLAIPALQSAHRSTHGRVMYTEIVGNLLHGIDACLESPCHGFASSGVPPGKIRQGRGKRPALGTGNFAELLRSFGRSTVTLHERLTSEKHLMSKPVPDAPLPNSLANESGIAALGRGTLLSELAE